MLCWLKYFIVIYIFLALVSTFWLWENINKTSFKEKIFIKPEVLDPSVNYQSASFIAVGDVSLSRNVAAQIKKANDPLLPFKNLAELLKSTDFNVANLESPFSGKSYFGQTGSLVFNAPLENIQGLVEYNFKILNLANNHALDQGLIGLENTIKYLADNGLQAFGAGPNQTAAWRPAIIDIRGIKIGFLGASYASLNDNGKTINEYVARIEDKDKLKAALDNLKPQVDLIIVNLHAGAEYTTPPNSSQIKFARTAIDYGADLVIGHHPHWIQILEQYQGKYIFYSLGNFIFDQMWSQKTREGLILKVNIIKKDDFVKISQIKLFPVIIENYSTPRLASPEEATRILKSIDLTSDTLIMN